MAVAYSAPSSADKVSEVEPKSLEPSLFDWLRKGYR